MESSAVNNDDPGILPNALSPFTIQEVVDGITYTYMTGFQNQFVSEVLPGAVPIGRNTPRIVPYNLYTEQLSGTAFTAPRSINRRSWLYRIQPSVATGSSVAINTSVRLKQFFGRCNPSHCESTVDPIRWNNISLKSFTPTDSMENENSDATSTQQSNYDFMDGMHLMCHAGDPSTRYGLAIYQYCHVTEPMLNKHMINTDGDFLIVPCSGTLHIETELGQLSVAATEMVVIPRGIIFSIHPNVTAPNDDGASGYVLEVYTCGGSSFHLPELGPIGSNGLANARDFYYPVAWCKTLDKEEYNVHGTIVTKKDSELFTKSIDHTPYNVVGWHGNYAPYKYNLNRFCAVNSVTYDHLDPSIFTVLTCPSGASNGTALADFVLFPSRRVLATDANTLRPPWFHRNVMSEYMGLIYGSYDAKKKGSFVPGGASLHNALTPHGPDHESYNKAVADPCSTPIVYEGGMAFMFETCLSLKVAPTALSDAKWRDMSYATDAWCNGLTAEQFTGWKT
jgi:homogentisate 1,2-dioxygenase